MLIIIIRKTKLNFIIVRLIVKNRFRVKKKKWLNKT
jgi:hypothetical protein